MRCRAQDASPERREHSLQCVFLPANCVGSPMVQLLSVVSYTEVGLSEDAVPATVSTSVSNPPTLIYLTSWISAELFLVPSQFHYWREKTYNISHLLPPFYETWEYRYKLLNRCENYGAQSKTLRKNKRYLTLSFSSVVLILEAWFKDGIITSFSLPQNALPCSIFMSL